MLFLDATAVYSTIQEAKAALQIKHTAVLTLRNKQRKNDSKARKTHIN